MTITMEQIQIFAAHLWARERGAGTIEKYLRDVRSFAVWLGDRSLTGEEAKIGNAGGPGTARQAVHPGVLAGFIILINLYFQK